MKREQLLEIMMLLSALESWGFSVKERIPDYLVAQIETALDALRKEVLK